MVRSTWLPPARLSMRVLRLLSSRPPLARPTVRGSTPLAISASSWSRTRLRQATAMHSDSWLGVWRLSCAVLALHMPSSWSSSRNVGSPRSMTNGARNGTPCRVLCVQIRLCVAVQAMPLAGSVGRMTWMGCLSSGSLQTEAGQIC